MMKLLGDIEPAESARSKTCCSLDDAMDARAVARRLDIPFYVFNFSSTFEKEVIGRFIQAYQNGETPNPCIDCNRYLKFERFLQRATELDCQYIATGHYARIQHSATGGRSLLLTGLDPSKDQSYMLYTMTQNQLQRTLFPLGGLTKPQVRELAEEFHFVNAKKQDSQDICFVPDGDYAAFIERKTGVITPSGNFCSPDGTPIGVHQGHIRYTLGQRRGIGISAKTPLYVCGKNPLTNTVTVAPDEFLYTTTLEADHINLIACESIPQPMRVSAKVRYRQTPQPAQVVQVSPTRLQVVFDTPQRAITKGQAVVLYDGEIVVGGGIIC